MHVALFPKMGLFTTSLHPAADELADIVRVTFKPPGDQANESIEIPLKPDTRGMEMLDISMHLSPTKAYQMADEYNEWFSNCFGFEVVLAYLGENTRPSLFAFSSNVAHSQAVKTSGWLSNLSTKISNFGSAPRQGLTFADCAPLLVVTEASISNVSARLEGVEADVTKFRPNIVIKNAPKAWDEDYWAELVVGQATIHLPHNCVRCQSLNVDFSTGKWAEGESGKVLKKLMKDRRIDAGMKYSPVFGRYGFLGESGGPYKIRVDDPVNVTKRNDKITLFGKSLHFLDIDFML